MSEPRHPAAITLDSWALLAWLQGEPAGKTVKDLLDWVGGTEMVELSILGLTGRDAPPKLLLNLINLGEIYYILGRKAGLTEADRVIDAIKTGPIELVGVPESLVLVAAALKVRYTISYADAFAAATAQVAGASLMTGDPELRKLTEVEVIWLPDR